MIEDDKLGLKVAENPVEALWEKTRRITEQSIKMSRENMIIEEAFLKMCEDKLESMKGDKE